MGLAGQPCFKPKNTNISSIDREVSSERRARILQYISLIAAINVGGKSKVDTKTFHNLSR